MNHFLNLLVIIITKTTIYADFCVVITMNLEL